MRTKLRKKKLWKKPLDLLLNETLLLHSSLFLILRKASHCNDSQDHFFFHRIGGNGLPYSVSQKQSGRVSVLDVRMGHTLLFVLSIICESSVDFFVWAVQIKENVVISR